MARTKPKPQPEDVLLDVDQLQTFFTTEHGVIRAVDGVSFQVHRGETLGIVGESGCGKSITAASILNMVPPPRGRIAGGTIRYHGLQQPVTITELEPTCAEMRALRGAQISMIFQEPMTSLTPVYTVGQQIMESVQNHLKLGPKEAKERAIEMLDKVGITPARQRVDAYPYQLSGGQRQRAMIAMALSCNPKLLIADEPTTALDVTIQAQIIDLLLDLQRELNMSIIIITHDLGVIGETADRVLVMYMGKAVEEAPSVDLFYHPHHPYTRGLLDSIPVIGAKHELYAIGGSVPSPYELPQGCYFAPRCPFAMDICRQQEPPMFPVGDGHKAACWLQQEGGRRLEPLQAQQQ